MSVCSKCLNGMEQELNGAARYCDGVGDWCVMVSGKGELPKGVGGPYMDVCMEDVTSVMPGKGMRGKDTCKTKRG